jgi:hypothetical protein
MFLYTGIPGKVYYTPPNRVVSLIMFTPQEYCNFLHPGFGGTLPIIMVELLNTAYIIYVV